MPKLAQTLKRSSGSRQVCVSVFFFSDHCIKQIDSMLPWICSVTDHRGRQNVVADVLRGSSRVPAPRGAGTRDMESYLLNYRIFISIHFRTLQEERKGEGEKGKSVSPTPPFSLPPCPLPLMISIWTKKGM